MIELNDAAFPLGAMRPGLTKREYFAAQALVGILASEPDDADIIKRADKLAEQAVILAGALCAELSGLE